MITLETLGSVGVITLSNPPHNLICRDFIEEFCCAQERAVADGMRAILIRSDLRHFCAGADVSALDSGGVDASVTLDRLESIPIPTVAAVPAPCWAAVLNLPWPATLLLLPSQRELAP